MSTAAIPQPEEKDLDIVQHPILGTLKFPKSMPFEQRNSMIADMESKAPKAAASPTAQDEWKKQRHEFEQLPIGQKLIRAFTPFGAPVPDPDGPHHVPGSFEGHPENVAEYIPATAGRAAEGVVDMSRGNLAMGGHKLIQAGTNAALPFAVMAAPAAPLATIRGLGGGYWGGRLGSGLAHAFGATPDQEALSGDIGNLAGGFAASSGLPRALLGTPTRNMLRAHGQTILDVMHPKEAITRNIKGLMTPAEEPSAQLALFNKTPKLGDSPIQSASALDRPLVSTVETPKTVGSAASAEADTAAFAKAKSELGTDATISQIAQRAQQIKQSSGSPAFNPKDFYAKTPSKSNLKANQRQMASPTGSSAPRPEEPYPQDVMNALRRPGEPTDAEITAIQNAVRARRMASGQ